MAPDWEKITKQQQHKGCFVLGTNIPETDLSDEEVFAAYKGQSAVERSFGFLKDPLFFVSSLFVKKPCRIQGLLMVMTLALLVYSVAQRRLRNELKRQGKSIENQIGQPKPNPTLRWIFQLLEGINRVSFKGAQGIQVIIEGITPLRRKILQVFGERVCGMYHISPSVYV